MKRLLAYSSISHAGYALLGLIGGTPEGASATMTYAFFYVFMTLGTFGVVIALGERGENVDGYQGLAAQRPGTAALMLLFLLSLTGIPPTAGFAAKFVVILSAVRAGYTGLAVLAVACSVGVGVHLHAGGRPDVHEGAARTGTGALPSRSFRSTRRSRAGHFDRRDRPRRLRGLGGTAVMLKMMYTACEVAQF